MASAANFKVICDPEFGGLHTAALAIDWGIKRCAVEDCPETRIFAILAGLDGAPVLGICQKHYLEAKAAGKWNYTLVW